MVDERTVIEEFGDLDVFLAFDEAQVEIRVMAELSDDKRLIQVISSGEDIHQSVGHDLTGLPPETFAHGKSRVMMKARHFSIVYGKIPENCYAELIAKGIKTTLEEVEEFYENYFGKYKGVKKYIDYCHEFAEDHGYAKTLFGLIREIPKVKEGGAGASWQNQAVNTPIQGTAHNLIMIALAQKKRKRVTYELLKHLLMEIHDALYFRIKLRDLPEAYRLGKFLLEDEVKIGAKKRFGVDLKVPLLAEAKVGFRLGAMYEGYKGGSISEFVNNWIEFNRETNKKIKESMKVLQ